MNSKKRILALALAALMLFGTLFSLLGTMASAAEDSHIEVGIGDGIEISKANSNLLPEPSIDTSSITFYRKDSFSSKITGKLQFGTTYNMAMVYYQTVAGAGITSALPNPYTPQFGSDKDFTLGSAFISSTNPKMKMYVEPDKDSSQNDRYKIRIELSNIEYKGSSGANDIYIDFTGNYSFGGVSYYTAIDTPIPTEYITGSGSSGSTGSDDDPAYTSDILIENVYVTDSAGERIDEVDEDSPAFSIVVTYADFGLREVDDDEFTSNSLEVYLTDPGGFVTRSGTKGKLTHISSTSNDAPRFRAEFRNLTYKEGGSTTIAFRANYDIFGNIVNGTATGVNVTQVANGENKGKLDPLTPHIIVSQYSYGGDQIVAGEDFTLNISIKNTSADIPLENIVMTIAPETIKSDTAGSTTGGLTITSASNTHYIEKLGVGESFSHSINLRAESNAAVGSHKVAITFKFQFVNEVKKERADGTDEEGIAIPVTQVDRFSVDPLTEIPDLMMAGEDGYITASFVNKGKTTTYNISGTMTGNMPGSGQSQHYGNLEAGKAASLDFDITSQVPGEVKGVITIQYEDENSNRNEVELPFSIEVEEMFYPEPPPTDPDLIGEESPGGLGALTIVLCSLGGLMMAAPIALYIYKRVKSRGIEAFDEDF